MHLLGKAVTVQFPKFYSFFVFNLWIHITIKHPVLTFGRQVSCSQGRKFLSFFKFYFVEEDFEEFWKSTSISKQFPNFIYLLINAFWWEIKYKWTPENQHMTRSFETSSTGEFVLLTQRKKATAPKPLLRSQITVCRVIPLSNGTKIQVSGHNDHLYVWRKEAKSLRPYNTVLAVKYYVDVLKQHMHLWTSKLKLGAWIDLPDGQWPQADLQISFRVA